jgi:hypothetical protein
LVEITHPFHPLRGEKFFLLKSRKLSKKDVLCLKSKDLGTINVPKEWTSLADPELVSQSCGAGMKLSPFKILELYQLIQSLKNRDFHPSRGD